MAWAELTEAELLQHISGQELSAFRRANQRPGEVDPLAGQIQDVTALVRGYILQCPRYKLGPDGTLPDILHDAAADLVVLRVMARSGGAILDQGGERKKAGDDARQLLQAVSEGRGPSIPLPTDAEGLGSEMDTRPPGVMQASYSTADTRQWTKANMDGL